VPIDQVEGVSDHRVVFRFLRERLNGSVYMRGRAESRRTLARVGGIWVYRRNGITFPLARVRLKAIGSPFTVSVQPPDGLADRVPLAPAQVSEGAGLAREGAVIASTRKPKSERPCSRQVCETESIRSAKRSPASDWLPSETLR
jgi:hypothetical protein